MTIKKFILVLLMILVFMFVSLDAGSEIKKEVPTKPGQDLDINLKSGGNVDITGWDKHEVQLIVNFPRGNASDWDIDVDKTPTGVKIISRYTGDKHKDHGGGTYTLKVPKKYDLKLKSMGGNISIKYIKGDITGKTMGGQLTLTQLKGFINLKTMGGSISLTESDIDGKVKTMGGRVLLENVVGDVSGSSMGGNVIYKNVKSRSGKSTGDIVNITTMGGDINVSEAKNGAKVKTMGGDIHINDAKIFVQATTMGGSITVDAIDGKCKATTMAGHVKVTMTGDPKKGERDVKLSSMSGDIYLYVPAQLDMDIDIELSYTKGKEGKYKIYSDFKLKQTKSDSWETRKGGSPRKYIYGDGNTGAATHKIKLKTINGNIYLKKK
jgi:DUF4097 and DUF4098 domain-containing protein YvlB